MLASGDTFKNLIAKAFYSVSRQIKINLIDNLVSTLQEAICLVSLT